MGLGNFDEFRDDRERGGINEAAVHEIEDFLLRNATPIMRAKLREEGKA